MIIVIKINIYHSSAVSRLILVLLLESMSLMHILFNAYSA